jgi:hypothetical protein
MNAGALPTGALLVHVLELAEHLDWPAAEIPPDTTIDQGREAWEAWSTHADVDRRLLARAIGVLVVRVHREPVH